MIRVRSKGDFDKTTKFLEKVIVYDPVEVLTKYGEIGLEALKNATPKDTGKTSESWYYKVEAGKHETSLVFYNSNIQDGVRVAVILDVGHGTGSGGYVRGQDYIDPSIRPIFNDIANAAWKEVTNA